MLLALSNQNPLWYDGRGDQNPYHIPTSERALAYLPLMVPTGRIDGTLGTTYWGLAQGSVPEPYTPHPVGTCSRDYSPSTGGFRELTNPLVVCTHWFGLSRSPRRTADP